MITILYIYGPAYNPSF